MGRKLYGEWSEFWPQQGPEVPFAETINGIDKYVVSSSLESAEWNNTTVLRGDVAAVQAVKDSIDGDIGMSGSATTVRWLLANGLLDELALLVHPVVVGRGQRLYEDPAQTQSLQLVHQEALPSGVLHVRYAPAPASD